MTRENAIKALTIQLEYWEQLKEKNVLTDHEGNNVVDVLKMAIEALQTEPVKHGEWISHEGYDECSLCHVLTTYGSHYCPNCGAKMDGGYDEK